ncbi:MAG: hypothetical protein BGO33_07895 [Bacteroidia bacterium 43-41]|nr:MAG: hypothetical protein BGO33_07895 [Bacteroidia bacterium 43-41]
MNLKIDIKNHVKNIIGKKISRKIVVFCVDDFGSIRTKNIDAYNKLVSLGNPISKKCIQKYDTLASNSDLKNLFDVLTSVKDQHNNYACFTPFTVVANPDFKKIRANNFQTYYRQSFFDTLKDYCSDYDNVENLWKEGIKTNIFYPAFHGTEHVNINRFMKALQENHKSTRIGFELESICIPAFPDEKAINKYTATYDVNSINDNQQLIESIKEGLRIFENLFGFRAKQFAPGAGIYSPDLNKTLFEEGVKFINVNRYRTVPLGNSKYKKKITFNSQKIYSGQYYIVRNSSFEPQGAETNRVALDTLNQIEAAFKWNTPAIISSHRLNFIGHFEPKWRDKSLIQLKYLLKEIVKKWPDVEFMNADQMAEILVSSEK